MYLSMAWTTSGRQSSIRTRLVRFSLSLWLNMALKTGERAARMHLWARNSMSSVLVTGSVDVAHWHLVFVVVVVVRIDWSWWLMLAVLAEDDTVLRRLADGLLGSESLLSNRHE